MKLKNHAASSSSNTNNNKEDELLKCRQMVTNGGAETAHGFKTPSADLNTSNSNNNKKSKLCSINSNKRRKRRRLRRVGNKNNSNDESSPIVISSSSDETSWIRAASTSASAATYRLPILTRVELVNNATNSSLPNGVLSQSQSQPSVLGATSSSLTNVESNLAESNQNQISCLFSDYLLVPSRTKFKHLLTSLFEQIELEDKQNLVIVDG